MAEPREMGAFDGIRDRARAARQALGDDMPAGSEFGLHYASPALVGSETAPVVPTSHRDGAPGVGIAVAEDRFHHLPVDERSGAAMASSSLLLSSDCNSAPPAISSITSPMLRSPLAKVAKV